MLPVRSLGMRFACPCSLYNRSVFGRRRAYPLNALWPFRAVGDTVYRSDTDVCAARLGPDVSVGCPAFLPNDQIGVAMLKQPVVEFQIRFDGCPTNFFKISPYAVQLGFGNPDLFMHC